MNTHVATPDDLAVCAQKALVPGSPFQVSFRFAPTEHAARVLALRACFAHIRAIPAEVSEPSLGRVKLAWWQRELTEAAEHSQHPVVRAMRDSGSLANSGEPLWMEYLEAVLEFMQTETFADEDSLRHLAWGIGGREALLEMGQGPPDGSGAREMLGAGCFLFRAILCPDLRKCQEAWWVPLSLQARHGCSRRSRESGELDSAWRDLRSALGQMALGWLEQGLATLVELESRAHHLAINAELKRRRLHKLLRNQQGSWDPQRYTPDFGEVIAAWRSARRLRRQAP